MGKWIQHYANGEMLVGTDQDVVRKMASWRKSNYHEAIGVDLEHDGLFLSIWGPGEYWQSDLYEAVFPGPNTYMIKRRIMKKLDLSNKYFYIALSQQSVKVNFNSHLEGSRYQAVQSDMINKWLVLECDLKRNFVDYYFSDRKF